MRILNFGSCNIDFVYAVDHILRPGETLAAESVSEFPGGKGLNQSIALARAGVKVYHAGCIGEDGMMLSECMKESGVDISYISVIDEKTGHAIIQVDRGGENSIVIYGGANTKISKAYMDEVVSDFGSGDYLVVQNEINNLDYLIDKAHDRGMQVVLNPSPFNCRVARLDLNKITYLILNEVEAEVFFGSSDPVALQKQVCKEYPDLKVILTLGKQGSVYFDSNYTCSHNAFCVNALDTTAAGDTFTGYLVASLSKGKTIHSAMRYASAASAIAVSRKGASVSIPTLKEVEVGLRELKINALDNTTRQLEIVSNYFQNYFSNGDLKGLAEALGYSKTYAGQWLKDNTGKGFSQHLIEYRCKVAADLLLSSDLSVSDIIQQVGYQNESHFRKVFLALYGCTPLKYRKRRQMPYGNAYI